MVSADVNFLFDAGWLSGLLVSWLVLFCKKYRIFLKDAWPLARPDLHQTLPPNNFHMLTRLVVTSPCESTVTAYALVSVVVAISS